MSADAPAPSATPPSTRAGAAVPAACVVPELQEPEGRGDEHGQPGRGGRAPHGEGQAAKPRTSA
jgi:hypothetical protein